MPTLFVFTRPVDQAQKSQIHEREKRSIRRRLREINDQIEVLKKRRRTTGHVSCDRTQDEEFGNKDMEADDEDVERICSNQNSGSHSSNEVEQSGYREVQSDDQEVRSDHWQSGDREVQIGDREVRSGDCQSDDREVQSGDREVQSGEGEVLSGDWQSGDGEVLSGDWQSGDGEVPSGDGKVQSGDREVESSDGDVEQSHTNLQPDGHVGTQTALIPVPMVCYVPLRCTSSAVSIIEGNDEATKFYTGLASWKLFQHILTFLENTCPSATPTKYSKMLPPDCLLLVLMRLRLNLRIEDLSYRFGITLSSVSDVFQRWIDVMFASLRFLIMWPSQETVHANMPQIFKDLYPRTRCIIDCSEIFIERPYSYQARAQTYSNYKKHNTVKFLIGITPTGAVSFLSKCWGGRATDKFITHHSGFLDKVEEGDEILADRGFDIADDLGVYGARLQIPSFTRGKRQLHMQEVEYSKKLSKVRIHVERVIGLIKNKYTILQSTLPISLIKHKCDSDYANIDKILTVCAALINVCPSVVP